MSGLADWHDDEWTRVRYRYKIIDGTPVRVAYTRADWLGPEGSLACPPPRRPAATPAPTTTKSDPLSPPAAAPPPMADQPPKSRGVPLARPALEEPPAPAAPPAVAELPPEPFGEVEEPAAVVGGRECGCGLDLEEMLGESVAEALADEQPSPPSAQAALQHASPPELVCE
jgi:hypothetical protein